MVTLTNEKILEYIQKSGYLETSSRIFELYTSGVLDNETFEHETGYLFVFTDKSENWPFLPAYRVSIQFESNQIEIDKLTFPDASKELPKELMKPLTGDELEQHKKRLKAKEKFNEKKLPKLE